MGVMAYAEANAQRLGTILSLTEAEVRERLAKLERPAVWADELVCLATSCFLQQALAVFDELAKATQAGAVLDKPPLACLLYTSPSPRDRG
eukprot:4071270-Amphidinium_carterae.1